MSNWDKSIYVFVADGTEEMELVITYDILVRAGLIVKSVSVNSGDSSSPNMVKCSRGVTVFADLKLEELEDSELLSSALALIVPGGPGSAAMSENPRVQKLLQTAHQKGTLIGCICAGTLSALTAEIGFGGKITSHPSVREKLEKDYEYSEDRVVESGNLITSRGPGTSFLFALTIVERLCGKDKRKEIEGPMVVSSQL